METDQYITVAIYEYLPRVVSKAKLTKAIAATDQERISWETDVAGSSV